MSGGGQGFGGQGGYSGFSGFGGTPGYGGFSGGVLYPPSFQPWSGGSSGGANRWAAFGGMPGKMGYQPGADGGPIAGGASDHAAYGQAGGTALPFVGHNGIPPPKAFPGVQDFSQPKSPTGFSPAQPNGSFSYNGAIDQSWRNIGKGDGFTGVRPIDRGNGPEMWQWVNGRPVQVTEGSPEADMSALTRSWGVGGTSPGNNPLLNNSGRWMG